MKKRSRKDNESLWQKLRSYRLHHNVYVLMLLMVLVVISTVVFYFLYQTGDQGFLPELMIAISTSLLASVFCMVSDMIVKYKECENDRLVKGLHEFGICDLHFDKKELLRELMADCKRECWISGYRLIMTKGLSADITKIAQNDREIRVLVCPPWSNAYKSVYGEKDQTIDNYFWVFKAILSGAETPGKAAKNCQVRFTEKPLFNDTYKVDDYLITGSYLHNRDKEHGRITATDFFCFDLEHKSQLYDLIHEEYETLWQEASGVLDWEKFAAALDRKRAQDLRESEKIDLLKNAFVELTVDNSSVKA